MSFKLISIAFNPGEPIPMKYTCDGKDFSPPLQWSGASKNVQSFALIMDDPDAGGFVHWVLYNLPPEVHGLPEAFPADTNLADHGKNSWHRLEYGGPCPPSGTHRYSFKLFALDTMLDLDASAFKADVTRVMQGHVLDQTELTGTYSRH
jgi:Raf kinase inhibitor-like YbhB/YbcL family protein